MGDNKWQKLCLAPLAASSLINCEQATAKDIFNSYMQLGFSSLLSLRAG
jgi:hypothetical protein